MNSLKNRRKERISSGWVEDKGKVKEALKKKKIDFAVSINLPFLERFMKFLESIGAMNELKGITGSHIRQMLAPSIFILIYIIKIIVGIPTMRGSDKLLGDMGAMKLLGFNVDSLKEGLCKRGDANQYGKGIKKNPLRNGGFYIIGECREMLQVQGYEGF